MSTPKREKAVTNVSEFKRDDHVVLKMSCEFFAMGGTAERLGRKIPLPAGTRGTISDVGDNGLRVTLEGFDSVVTLSFDQAREILSRQPEV